MTTFVEPPRKGMTDQELKDWRAEIFSKDAYRRGKNPNDDGDRWAPRRPRGWEEAEEFTDIPSGFFARIYHNVNGDEAMMAFRGTNELWKDLGADIQLHQGWDTDQVRFAVGISERMARQYSNLTFTGHSLGGGLAMAAALATNGNAITFNAARMGVGIARSILNGQQYTGSLRYYVVDLDYINNGQSSLTNLPWPFNRAGINQQIGPRTGQVIRIKGDERFDNHKFGPLERYFTNPNQWGLSW